MNFQELVSLEAVEDYSLKAREHAKIFDTSAPELAAVLTNASLAIESDAFARWDDEAITAQICMCRGWQLPSTRSKSTRLELMQL